MTDLRQAAQQAMEALDSGNPYHQQLAAKVLRTVLEQQAEPVAWRYALDASVEGPRWIYIDKDPHQWLKGPAMAGAVIETLYTTPPQQQAAPVSYATKEDFHREIERRLKHIREEMKIKSVTMRCKDYDIALPIIDTDFGRVLVSQVFTPPQRKPLTDEQIFSVLEKLQMMYNRPPTTDSRVVLARAIEAAHNIKEGT